MMFYVIQCWDSILCCTKRLENLEFVLVVASQMMFRLEGNTFLEASLALTGLEQKGGHILQHLVRQQVRKHLAELEISGSQTRNNRVTTLQFAIT